MNAPPTRLLYHFCRMQLPGVVVAPEAFERHLQRTFELFRAKGHSVEWAEYLTRLYLVDWYLCCACMEGDGRAWEVLFAARASRADRLLIDALRARAARLYPRDVEKQESAVTEFWSRLLASDRPESLPVLARYDGQRPLVPWLIRVFQNWHVSQLRRQSGIQALPDDDLAMPLPAAETDRWQEAFCQAAQEWLATLKDRDLLVLGLRLRYRLSQREAAELLGLHEGTLSRQTDKLGKQCLDFIGDRLTALGWTGEDLSAYVLKEMAAVILDDARLSADRLAALLKLHGKPGAGQALGRIAEAESDT